MSMAIGGTLAWGGGDGRRCPVADVVVDDFDNAAARPPASRFAEAQETFPYPGVRYGGLPRRLPADDDGYRRL
jgi:hypothetical protein